MIVPAPTLLHADVIKPLLSAGFDLRRFAAESMYRNEALSKLAEDIYTISGSDNLWLPTYNYDFCIDGKFDVQSTPGQVGVLSEYFRKFKARWRTNTPIFSVCGVGEYPPLDADRTHIDPFGPKSEFAVIMASDGSIGFWGVNFSPTFIHFVERNVPNGPLYRYDKVFRGFVIDYGVPRGVDVKYHVRPRGLEIVYDVARLHDELVNEGILIYPNNQDLYCTMKAREFYDYCLDNMKRNPYFLLTPSSADVVKKLIDELGRRFCISDFENKEL